MVWSLRDDLDGDITAQPSLTPLAAMSLSAVVTGHVAPSRPAPSHAPLTAGDGDAAAGSGASGGINSGSQAGLSQVMTYTRDVAEGRYEYTGNQLIDGVIFGSRWTVTNITFSFPATAEFYTTPYYQPGHLTNHIPFNAAQQAAARYAFALVASYTSVTFTEVTESAETHGIIRMSQTNNDAALPSAEGWFPGSDAWDGDIWFGDNNQPFYLTPAIGNWGQATMMHEIGHTLGLKHGQDNYTSFDLTVGGYLDGPGPHYGTAALPADKDGWAWSLMTYRSAPGFSVIFQGDRYNQPQTYMQADIAALQFMYGANFTTNATDSVYSFDATTGEMFINGVGQGAPEFNTTTGIGKIFRTIWDGDGVDTYDFANYGNNQAIDLRPGQFSTFSTAQLADSRPVTAGFTAQPGNIANALLYQGDVRSLIENAIAGSGNDTIIGNQATNALTGNDGNDVLDGGAGDDVMTGGAGDDTYGVDAAGDVVTEASGQGTDAVAATISYTLGDHVENLTLASTAGLSGTGNGLANRITGGSGSNTLSGLDGNDTLIGSFDYRTPAQTLDETGLTAHSTLATALALTGFGVTSDPDIVNATTAPHTTVVGNGAGGTYDMYSFVVEAAGVVGTFDIDLTAVLNSFVELYDASGTRLAYNNDSVLTDGAGGSYATTDSFLTYTFAAAGTYYLRVGRYVNSTTSGALAAGHSYILQVSLAGNALPPLLDGNDTLDGGSGEDSLIGGLGDDLLDGGLGDDVLDGGTGNDTYWVDSAADLVTEAAGAGIDTVVSTVTWSLAGREIEHLTLAGTGDIDATGNAFANVLTGNGGNNHLDGGAGHDSLAGGQGDDTYVVEPGDVVTELAGEGTDTVLSGVTWTLSEEIENLVLAGAADIDGTGNSLANAITGNGGANRLDGGEGDDTLTGGSGHDTYWVDSSADAVAELTGEGDDTVRALASYTLSDHVENLELAGTGNLTGTGNGLDNRLSGNSGNNSLTGLGGHDLLDGGSGADTMLGGLGDDTYVVDDTGDVVTESSNQGTDTIRSSVTYTLVGRQVEILVLTGADAIGATGNNLSNSLTGNDAANSLNGGVGDDTLNGGGGNDSLTGGTGADLMAGGLGDDTYVIDDAGDTTVELAGEGTDTVRTALSWVLADHVENLVLTGTAAVNATGNGGDNLLTGNSAANVLAGGLGLDTLTGGSGNDTYVIADAGDVIVENAGGGSDLVEASVTWTLAANVERLILTGTADINGTGNDLNNLLTGNAGSNVLTGGLGHDTYVVSAGDVVIENSGGGTDLVESSVAWTLGADVERLTLTGMDAIAGTGNELNNILTGNAGNNVLTGGLGNDTYYIQNTGDVVVELAGEGTDLIYSTVSYALTGRVVEALTLTGTADINATGNANPNTLTGNDGNNILNGKAGTDKLTGGLGADIFLFETGSGKDTINDFSAAQNDTLNIHAYTGGVANEGLMTQVGGNVVITFSSANVITVLNATVADVLAHTLW